MELKKCQLLCSNCHAEVEDVKYGTRVELVDLPELQSDALSVPPTVHDD